MIGQDHKYRGFRLAKLTESLVISLWYLQGSNLHDIKCRVLDIEAQRIARVRAMTLTHNIQPNAAKVNVLIDSTKLFQMIN
jgi:hypothetical protein